eukprot:CAMPEP_0170648646 /NCGR_PEP_ID=MMETSP0224-20130122/44846_1 /TAXON_ID=285029 /ORGANISM="Togula jolla, Strain CCCM 725" /LENGTH=158 /DNA_ID=CAMNT_0010980187 /DNA_START=44 /DNA_END=520 /DNA_ORIENTATION=-
MRSVQRSSLGGALKDRPQLQRSRFERWRCAHKVIELQLWPAYVVGLLQVCRPAMVEVFLSVWSVACVGLRCNGLQCVELLTFGLRKQFASHLEGALLKLWRKAEVDDLHEAMLLARRVDDGGSRELIICGCAANHNPFVAHERTEVNRYDLRAACHRI